MSIIQKEIFNTSKELAKKNKISEEYVMESLKSAIISEYTKEYVDAVVDVEIDTEKSQINISRIFTVVADDQSENFDDNVEIPLEEAKTYKADIQVGDTFKKPISFDSLNKMLIQNIWNLFKHLLNAETNKAIYNDWKQIKGTIGYYEVEKTDGPRVIVKIDKDIYGIVNLADQIRGESIISGKKYYFYVKDVLQHSKDWPIILSRNDDALLIHLLNKNVPEIADGIVEIKGIARIPGYAAKIAVTSTAEGINPVSTIIGPGGSRIRAVQAELNNERIDPVKYSDDLKTFIINICHPIYRGGVSISQISGISITDRQVTVISENKVHNPILISKLVDRKVDVITPEDAESIELEYEKVESVQQNRNNRQFNNSFEKKEKVDLGMKKFEDLFND